MKHLSPSIGLIRAARQNRAYMIIAQYFEQIPLLLENNRHQIFEDLWAHSEEKTADNPISSQIENVPKSVGKLENGPLDQV